MTCIVGLVADGRVYIGGDSAGSDGWSVQVRADAKVFKVKDMLFGFTSSFRMGALLRYSFTPPLRDPAVTVDAYMNTSFITAVRDCLKSGGFAKTKEGNESGGTFLVGYAGRLFEIGDDYQVGETTCGYGAVGSGYLVAEGAMHATAGMKDSAARVRAALDAAEHHASGVRGPFVIEWV